MKFAPALTWMHLFPAGTTLDCREVPPWFSELVRPDSPAGTPGRAIVSFDADGETLLSNAAGADGIVAVNSRGMSQQMLEKAGFNYARRFAVIPDLARARWFIPLDCAAVASAGFGLYSPARLLARLKLIAVQLAARLGIGGWYKDAVWVASRSEPPLEKMVHRVLPGKEIRLALSAGAPEPARNRKATAAVLGLDGSTLAFVKLPTSPLATTLVHQEAAALEALGQQFGTGNCPVPRLLFAGESDGRYALVQAPLTGKPTSARLTPLHRNFLDRLQTAADRKPAGETAFFQSLNRRVDSLGAAAADLAAVLQLIGPRLAETIVPRTVIHGDFAPWNVRRTPKCESIAAFDWEYAALDGLPLIDATHFEIQVGYLLNNWSPQRANEELERRAAAEGGAYSPAQVRALQAVYFVDSIARLMEEGYAVDDEMVMFYRRVLSTGPGAARHWTATTP